MLMLKLRFENVHTSTMGICPHREGLKFLKMSCVRINVHEEYFEMHISLFSYVAGKWVSPECRHTYMVLTSEHWYVCMYVCMYIPLASLSSISSYKPEARGLS